MEVASPLTFAPNSTGTKRHLPCSPGFVDSTNRSSFGAPLDTTEEFLPQRNFKRRRFNTDVCMDGDAENTVNQLTFGSQQHLQKTFQPTSPNVQSSFKRCRTEVLCPQQDAQKIVQSQAAEIESLKHEKSCLESSLTTLKQEHEKVLNENKILKRAVTIQQDRQNQAASEIQAARQVKFEADDKIKKLEQIILSLRYHLQTQQSIPANDFMGFPPRPPDVF